jgi:hypothetical protein
MALRKDICVVASESSLTVYSTPSNGPCELLQVLQLDHSVTNVSVSAEDETLPLDESADATHQQQQPPSPSQPQRQQRDTTRMLLFTTSSSGINVLRLREQRPKDSTVASSATFSVDVLAEEDLKRGDVLSSKPSQPHFGGSNSRLAWIHAPTSFLDRTSASLVTARFVPRDPTVTCTPTAPAPAPTPTPATPDVTVTGPVAAAPGGPADVVTSSGGAAKLEIMSECKSVSLPSFHFLPVLDYDDGAGLVAIGNGCGELVVCNYAGGALGREVVRCFKEVPVPVVDEL